MPDEALALAVALGLLTTGEKKPMAVGEWYYEHNDNSATQAYIEFELGVWECDIAELMQRTQTAKGSYRAQIVLYTDNYAERIASPTQLKEYFVESGYISYGHHLVARKFIIRGPCTLIGQCIDKLGDTFNIKLACVLRKIS